MRQIIPFSKDIEFKTMINEITNISLEHNLSLKDEYNINGDFIITGKYKINATSPAEEDFSYKIPIDIAIDHSYKTDHIELEIDDFKYTKLDSNKLKVDIDLSIDNLEKKLEKTLEEKAESVEKLEEVRESPEEIETLDFDERKLLTDNEKEQIKELISSDNTSNLFEEISTPSDPILFEEKIKTKDTHENVKTSVGSLFEAFKDTEETFSTYSVYIIRNGDNIDDVISRYKTSREILEEYNDMSNIKIGTKLIIPNTKDENDK